jgi:hypothetical protein
MLHYYPNLVGGNLLFMRPIYPWWESQRERDHLEDQGVDGRMESEWMLGRLAGGVYIGSIWLRIGTGGGLF